ncbi:MAG: murein transglycosylase [Proteobacteria bacterium]|nr:murein transglycosylase [Pseudomonadota bacterium]MBS1246664.1 murein transglycosylase [Pseudomonadota bacterium]
MPLKRRSRRQRLPALLIAACLLGSGCNPADDNKLKAVQRSGELVVLTRNSPTTYYEGPDGPTGFEYDLARAFAEQLGVSLRIKVAERFADILPMIARGEADFAAAGLTVTAQRAEQVRFTPHYQIIRQQVVHHAKTAPPADVKGLIGRHIEVIAGSSTLERLEQLKEQHPKLNWVTVGNMETEELLLHVQEGLTELTISDSNIIAISRQFSPDLRIAFDLGDPEMLAWAFPPGTDDSLYQEAARFIETVRASGELSHLIERHYGAASRFNPINIAAFLQKIETDLPRLKPLFEEAAQRYQLDWRLLAAISYQESYWNQNAVSPTGVRGIMMLTETTAQHLGISDRLDVRQSVHGGSAYLRKLIDSIPARIPEPDRTWMALAAYNVGISHLEDARIITQTQGADPDKWNDLKERLPLLAKAAWYTKTKHGYARGYEPVQLVNRVRTYYEVLKKNDNDSRARHNNDALRLKAPAL